VAHIIFRYIELFRRGSPVGQTVGRTEGQTEYELAVANDAR